MPENSFDSILICVINCSLNKEEIKIKSQMFQYKVWPLLVPDMLYNIDGFIDGVFVTLKR